MYGHWRPKSENAGRQDLCPLTRHAVLLVSLFPGQDNQVHYSGCSVAAVRVRRTTRIEPALAGVGSLAETIDPLRATQSPGISPAFDRQTRQPRSHYFAPESVRSCGANEKLR